MHDVDEADVESDDILDVDCIVERLVEGREA